MNQRSRVNYSHLSLSNEDKENQSQYQSQEWMALERKHSPLRYNYSSHNLPKDTITTSSQLLSERTMNLKQEISNLDDEIVQLQHNLQSAMSKKML